MFIFVCNDTTSHEGRQAPILNGFVIFIVIFDLQSLNTTTMHDPIKTIVYSSNQNNVSDVIINGKFILKDRNFVSLNENNCSFWSGQGHILKY